MRFDILSEVVVPLEDVQGIAVPLVVCPPGRSQRHPHSTLDNLSESVDVLDPILQVRRQHGGQVVQVLENLEKRS